MLRSLAFLALVGLNLSGCSDGHDPLAADTLKSDRIQANQTNDSSGQIEKVSRQMVWQPEPGGTQVALWPEDLAILEPDTGDHAEEVGNGSRLVAGRPWHWASYVTRPTMTIYRPKGQHSGTTILVLPGGGYAAVAMDVEGTEICDWITRQNMTCVLLKYRVPQEWPRNEEGIGQPPRVQLPLQDAQRAIGLLRHLASQYGIDAQKVGVMGFSAGGHLAAAISNTEERTYTSIDSADRQSSLPDFAVLLYPGRLWHRRSPKTHLDLAPWVPISPKAPPTLLIHAMDDPVDDVRHSMAYSLALHEAGVPADLRLYAKGGHAFGMRPTSAPITTQWPGQVQQWLRDINAL